MSIFLDTDSQWWLGFRIGVDKCNYRIAKCVKANKVVPGVVNGWKHGQANYGPLCRLCVILTVFIILPKATERFRILIRLFDYSLFYSLNMTRGANITLKIYLSNIKVGVCQTQNNIWFDFYQCSILFSLMFTFLNWINKSLKNFNDRSNVSVL